MPDHKLSPHLAAASDRFNLLSSELNRDAKEALNIAKGSGSTYDRRAAFRTVFAAIEGLIFLLKDQVMANLPIRRKYFTDAEVALLREESYQLNIKGKAVTKPRFLPLEENLKFTLEMYIKGKNISLDLDLQGSGWQAFKSSLSIRHRVTHPRVPEDLEVSAEDLSRLEIAFNWVNATIVRNMARALLAVMEQMYLLWESHIPKSILEQLDLMLENPKSTFDTNQIRKLADLGVFESESDSAILTFDGKEFVKWRNEKRGQKPSTDSH